MARTAVSLTPVALEADSRAFRIAGSLADAGFRSIVIEGRASVHQFWGDAIEVRSAGHPSTALSAPIVAGGRLRNALSPLRDGRLGTAGELALYLGFRGYEWWRHCYQPGRLLPPAALYYLHSFEFYRTVYPVAAHLGARIVYDAHDFYRGIEPAASRRSFDRNRLRPFLDPLEDRVIAEADVAVTVSEGIATLIEQVSGRRPAVIRNCHDERHDLLGAPELRTTLGLAPSDRLCVVVGNWKPGMAVNVATEAIARLPERFHLAFLGRGYDQVAQTLPRDAPRDRVHFGLAAAPNAIVPAIRSADIGLVIYEPYSENYRHALPNGFFQVVAAGLPVVRAFLPEIEAAIGGRDVGVCLNRLDPAALAQAIAKCADDNGMLRASAAALAQELRWEREAFRLRQLLDNMLAGLTRSRVATELVPN